MSHRPLLLAAALFTPCLFAPSASAYDAAACAEREGELCDENDAEEAAALAEDGGPEPVAPVRLAGSEDRHERALKQALGGGNWGAEFRLVAPDGRARPLAQVNNEVAMIPASTMKLFTGWFGFIKEKEARRRYPAPFRTFLAYAATMIKASVNPMANLILRLSGGAAAMTRFYAGLGLPTESLVVADGAGLSARNRASARLEVALLEHIKRSEHYAEFKALMAEPGEAGTLRARLGDLAGRVHAKTGTLPRTGVASLAGFVDAGEAGVIVFSVIGNDRKIAVTAQRARIDAAVRAVREGVLAEAAEAAVAVRRPAQVSPDLAGRLTAMVTTP
ncbi:MAG: D-alanyl-D-alanine carboxypeptidase [Elusimicrobiota bacterium]|nr:D-alanyl-D-alanine carboxypeptidase [Elusimicrobiota bacterium]